MDVEILLKIVYYFIDEENDYTQEEIDAINIDKDKVNKQDAINGDYSSVSIFDKYGNILASYGSYYDDKGCSKVIGFVDGIKYCTKSEVKVEEINKLTIY